MRSATLPSAFFAPLTRGLMATVVTAYRAPLPDRFVESFRTPDTTVILRVPGFLPAAETATVGAFFDVTITRLIVVCPRDGVATAIRTPVRTSPRVARSVRDAGGALAGEVDCSPCRPGCVCAAAEVVATVANKSEPTQPTAITVEADLRTTDLLRIVVTRRTIGELRRGRAVKNPLVVLSSYLSPSPQAVDDLVPSRGVTLPDRRAP